jgi:hypothetical protein
LDNKETFVKRISREIDDLKNLWKSNWKRAVIIIVLVIIYLSLPQLTQLFSYMGKKFIAKDIKQSEGKTTDDFSLPKYEAKKTIDIKQKLNNEHGVFQFAVEAINNFREREINISIKSEEIREMKNLWLCIKSENNLYPLFKIDTPINDTSLQKRIKIPKDILSGKITLIQTGDKSAQIFEERFTGDKPEIPLGVNGLIDIQEIAFVRFTINKNELSTGG